MSTSGADDSASQTPPTFDGPPAMSEPPASWQTAGAPQSWQPPPAPAPKKRHLGLIIGGSVAALVLLGGGIGLGLAAGSGNGASDSAAAGSSSATPTQSDTPSLADPTNIVGTPVELPTPTASTMSLGSALSLQSTSSVSGGTATADVTVYSIEANAQSSNGYVEPSTGQFVKVDVGTAGTSAASFPYNAFDFVLQATNGQIFQPSFESGFEPGYNSGDIAQGQTVRGFIVFDIPTGSVVKQVSYQVTTGVLGSWAVA